MRLFRGISLRTTVLLPIFIIGILGAIATVVTGNVYRELILKNTTDDLANMIKLEANQLLSEHKDITSELGLTMQKEHGFKNALNTRNLELIQFLLDEQFHQYFVTTGAIKVKAIYAFDREFNLFAVSKEGDEKVQENPVCAGEVEIASQREGPDRLKIFAALCAEDDDAYFSTIVPVGSLSPIGYLQIISDPVNTLAKAEKDIGMPVMILDHTLQTRFRSTDWPNTADTNDMIVGIFNLDSRDEILSFTIAIARDITLLNQLLNSTRSQIFLVGGLSVLGVIAFFLFFINQSVLRPLASLGNQLQRVGTDKKQLSEELAIKGNAEVRRLALSYNKMSKELNSLYCELEAMAFTDPLTTLPNRSQLQRQLSLYSELAKDSRASFALLMMDLDKFKDVNDTLGHHAGDDLLMQVSQRLQKILRKTDTFEILDTKDVQNLGDETLARLGGDEFAAILPFVPTEEDAIVVANKIIKEFSIPFKIESQEFNIGVSIGIAMAPLHNTDPSTLLRYADAAMYKAKNGRMGYCMFSLELDSAALSSLHFDNDIMNALKKNEMQLYFQPKFDLHKKAVTGVEALIRWNSPVHGFVPPDKLIAHAEKSSIIHQLTKWVLQKATESAQEWTKHGYDLNFAVNLSAQSLNNSELLSQVQESLQQTGLPAKRLILEITETAIMSDPKRALHMLYSLSNLGVRLSIDDFGTGYSSLSYLKQLPVDEIKIDRSFVMEMMKNTNDTIIVRSIIDLAHNMDMRVVAEGVEDETTMNQLAAFDCDVLQGYFFARPMPLNDLLKWFNEVQWNVNKEST